ncbi:MAG: hypothetical protein AB8E15_04465 [Bdellovibrionales bacterium]
MKSAYLINRTSHFKENSFVGLSIGVSPIDKESLKLILKYLKKKPTFVIGYSNQKYNNFVFEGKSLVLGKAEELAMRSGDLYIKELGINLKSIDCSDYKIIRWNQLKSKRYRTQIELANN